MSKMKKRILSIILFGVLLLSSCQTTGTGSTEKGSPSPSDSIVLPTESKNPTESENPTEPTPPTDPSETPTPVSPSLPVGPLKADFAIQKDMFWFLDLDYERVSYNLYTSPKTRDGFIKTEYLKESSIHAGPGIPLGTISPWLENESLLLFQPRGFEEKELYALFQNDGTFRPGEEIVCNYTAVICYREAYSEDPYKVTVAVPQYAGRIPSIGLIDFSVPLDLLEISPDISYEAVIFLIDNNGVREEYTEDCPWFAISMNDWREEPIIDGQLVFWTYGPIMYHP